MENSMAAATMAKIMIAIFLSSSLWDNHKVDGQGSLNILYKPVLRELGTRGISLLYNSNQLRIWSDVCYVKEKFMIPEIVSFMMVIDLIESHA